MSRSPIPRALSTLRRQRVRCLLMGGQACILYGAAEFSRDVDLAVAVEPANLARLARALEKLEAEPVDVPPLSASALRKGHACHFRCLARGLHGLRIDVMSRMRGAAPFGVLWRRRLELALPGVGTVPVMSLPDLVRVKKTQRDKDWPMIRRLVEADIQHAVARPPRSHVQFWLSECRSPELLVALARDYPDAARKAGRGRPALRAARSGHLQAVERQLKIEEERERAADRRYWAPLRKDLERMRRERREPRS